MEWLALFFAFELGYQPQAMFVSYDPPSFVNGSGQFYQTFEVKARMWDFLEVGGAVRVQDWLSRGTIGFWPNQLDSQIFADVYYGPLTIGWRHNCIHPVVPYQPTFGEKPSWDGAYDEVYLRIGGKL